MSKNLSDQHIIALKQCSFLIEGTAPAVAKCMEEAAGHLAMHRFTLWPLIEAYAKTAFEYGRTEYWGFDEDDHEKLHQASAAIREALGMVPRTQRETREAIDP